MATTGDCNLAIDSAVDAAQPHTRSQFDDGNLSLQLSGTGIEIGCLAGGPRRRQVRGAHQDAGPAVLAGDAGLASPAEMSGHDHRRRSRNITWVRSNKAGSSTIGPMRIANITNGCPENATAATPTTDSELRAVTSNTMVAVSA